MLEATGSAPAGEQKQKANRLRGGGAGKVSSIATYHPEVILLITTLLGLLPRPLCLLLVLWCVSPTYLT